MERYEILLRHWVFFHAYTTSGASLLTYLHLYHSDLNYSILYFCLRRSPDHGTVKVVFFCCCYHFLFLIFFVIDIFMK